MRQLRQEVKAEAQISKEMAGVSTRNQEAEFLAYARNTTAEDEFAALIGLAGEVDGSVPAAREKEQEGPASLPE